MVITIAFLLGVVFGRGGQQQAAEKQDTVPTEAQQAETVENTEQEAKTTGKEATPLTAVVAQGETAELPDRTFTVNDIQRGYVFPSNIPKPGPGNEFILVNVTITNTTSQPIQANSYNFESEDSSGVRVRAHATNTPPDAIFLNSIAPNGELTGNLVFEVQQSDPTIKIVYQPR